MAHTKNFFIDAGYPARENVYVLPLINGEDAWRSVYNDITAAQKSIHMCFWAMEGDLELIRDDQSSFHDPGRRGQNTIYTVLAKKSQKGIKVRILLWDYPLNARQDFADTLIRLSGKAGHLEVLYQPHPGEKVSTEQFFGSWHQKTIIIDEEIAYVSGMNAKENDWDTSDHKLFDIKRAKFRVTGEERREMSRQKEYKGLNSPRHDYMAKLNGSIVADVHANFIERWNYCIDERMDYYEHATKIKITPVIKSNDDNIKMQKEPSNDGMIVKAQISRTMPAYKPCPNGEKGILETYIKAIGLAEKYIYIEDQYFRSQSVAKAIADACKNNKLKIVVVTPPAYFTDIEPYDVIEVPSPVSTYWTTKAFDVINKVRPDFRLNFLQTHEFLNIGRLSGRKKHIFLPIDLHAKIMIIDDEWYTVGSCNVNDRGFEYEGELNVSVKHASAKEFRKAIFTKHLKTKCPDDIDDAFELWSSHLEINNQAWSRNTRPKSFVYSYEQGNYIPPTSFHNWF